MTDPQAVSEYRDLVASRYLVKLLVAPDTGRILDASQAAADFYSRSREELRQLAAWDLTLRTREDTLALLAAVASGQDSSPHPGSRHRRHDGELRDVMVYPDLVACAGRVLILATVIDVTEQRRTEARLRHREEQFRALVSVAPMGDEAGNLERLRESERRFAYAMEATSDGIWDWNVVTGATYYSPGYARMLGYAPDELAPHMDTWIDLLHPEERADVLVRAQHPMGNSGYRELEFRMRTKTGGYRWILSRGKVVERAADGAPRLVVGTHVDITERKETELDLRRYRQTVETANDMLVYVDRDLRYRMVNPAYAAFHRTTPEHLLGRRIEEVESPETYAQIRPHLEATLAGEARRYVAGTRDPAGQTRWIDADQRPFVEHDAVVGIVVSLHDLTEVRQAQAALEAERTHLEERVAERTAELRASEAKLRTIYDVLPVGISITDPAGRLVDCNRASERLLGLSRDAHLRRAYDGQEWGLVRLDGTPMPPDEYASVRAMREGRAVRDVEMGVVRAHGTTWLSVSAMPSADPDYGVVIAYVDISERIEAGRRIAETLSLLRLAAQAADVGIWSWEIVGDKLDWDERMCAWYEVPEEVRGRGVSYEFWKQRLHPDDSAHAEAVWAAALANQIPYEDVFRLRLPHGQIRHIHTLAVIERDPAGQPWRLVGANRDITAQRAYEETLRDATGAAEAAARAKSEFLAHMSHEIRTPMNAVLGLAQVLGLTALEPDQRAMLGKILTAGRSLLGILNDILDLSKMEAGRLRLEALPFKLERILAALDDLHGVAARDKGLALRIAAPPALQGRLLGDPLRLEQVLVNLVGNAVKFTERGEVGVRVDTLECTAATVRLRFEVQDTGIGIAPETRARLFAPFAQGDDSITRRFGGTGLGLAICKRLVEAMGGEIGVASVLGQGSRFWFALCLARTTEESAPPAASLPGPLPVRSRLAGLHVLVADDSPMNREVAMRMLALAGACATPAADGREALERLRAAPQGFDLVLMDVQMPTMDGLTATRLIRTELGLTALPILALTAGVLPEQQAAARAAGMNDVLTKPLDAERMAAALSRWLASRPGAVGAAAPPTGATRPDEAGPFPVIPGIDRGRVVQALGGDLALFRSLLERFAEECTDSVGETRRALAAGEHATAASHLHRLGGTAGTVGAREIMESARVLEAAITQGATDLEAPLAALGERVAALIAAGAPWRATDSATRAATAVAPPTPDTGQVQALRESLRTRDLDALRRLDALRPALVGVMGEARTARLSRAVRNLRFAQALAVLDETLPGEEARDVPG